MPTKKPDCRACGHEFRLHGRNPPCASVRCGKQCYCEGYKPTPRNPLEALCEAAKDYGNPELHKSYLGHNKSERMEALRASLLHALCNAAVDFTENEKKELENDARS